MGGLYLLVTSSFVLLAAQAQDCPKPQQGPANTVLTSADIIKPTFEDGSTATWECEVGYEMKEGNRRQTCTAGTWIPEIVTLKCDRKTCGSIPDPDNGRIDFPNGNQFGDTAVIICNTGHNLVGGSKERTCGTDGKWGGRFGRCEVVKCGKPADIVSGTYSPKQDDYDYGSVVTYKCNSGFTLRGRSSLDCQTDEKFHPEPPTCILVKCDTPNVPNLSRYEGPPPPYGYKHHVTFKCDSGFNLVGSTSVTCEIAGWTPPLPRCEKVETCGSIPEPDNGRIDFPNGNQVGDMAVIICDTGYNLVGGSKERTCGADGNWGGRFGTCEALTTKATTTATTTTTLSATKVTGVGDPTLTPSTGTIVGICLGVIALVAGCGVGFWFVQKKKKRSADNGPL